jgi:hypothetical protein
MNIGDIVIDYEDNKYIIYDIDKKFIYAIDFATQKECRIFLVFEIKELVIKPNNVQWMFLNRRVKALKDVKGYL